MFEDTLDGKMRRGHSAVRSLGLVAFAVAVVCPSVVWAQGFDVHHLLPNPELTEPYFNSASAHTRVKGDYSVGVLLDYAKDPLVLVGSDGQRIAALVNHQLTGNVAAAVALSERLTVGLAVPVVFSQSGDSVSYLPSAPNAGLGAGDIRIVPRLVLVRGHGESRAPRGFALAMAVDVAVPTGARDQYQGEGLGVEPKAIAEWVLPSALRFAATLGYAVRPKATLLDLTINDMVTWTVASAYPATDRLTLTGEVRGAASVLAKDIGTAELPVELLVGGKHTTLPCMTLMAGGGVGLIHGAGAPDWRVFVGAAFHNVRRVRPVEKDSDADGISDAKDACPFAAEDRDAFADDDGCPDLDNDADGILDTNDSCPNVAEDLDAFEDDDGCPDPDNDHDGIGDGADACPLEPETVNAFEDSDGCPDVVPSEPLVCKKIDLAEKIYYDTARATIQRRSFAQLDRVAELLRDTPSIKKVRIDGHTDDRGREDVNLALSHARALSVVRYLVQHGVDAGRLEGQGFGEAQPIASNATAEGREQNRRVELVILEQEGSEHCVEAR